MDQAQRPRRRKADSTTHHEPYPDRLHRHVTGAADALARLASPVEADAEAPTPAEFVDQYGATDGLNASKGEVSDE